MLLKNHDRLLFIGDSITDCGRGQPVGEAGALGNGYVSLVDGLIQIGRPDWRIRVMNLGSSGHRVRDLAARWTTDVLDLKPDVVSIMIGTNDVWRQFDQPRITESHVLPAEYERTLNALVEQTRPTVRGLVMMTPFFLEPNTREPMRRAMDRYGKIVGRIAARHDCVLVDTQEAYAPLLQHVHPMGICWDRVHPNLAGHLVLAKAFVAAIGMPLK